MSHIPSVATLFGAGAAFLLLAVALQAAMMYGLAWAIIWAAGLLGYPIAVATWKVAAALWVAQILINNMFGTRDRATVAVKPASTNRYGH